MTPEWMKIIEMAITALLTIGVYLVDKYGEFACEACATSLRLFSVAGERKGIVFWDHRDVNSPYGRDPSSFLRSHRVTAENISLWESYDFGMLCTDCNKMAGSPVGRKERLERFLCYTLHPTK